MRFFNYAAAAGAAFCILPGTAMAIDETPCEAKMICASKPDSVADAIRDAGYKAVIGTDNQGDPKVSSAASGYNFSVLFYDCEKAKQCGSLQFYISFNNDDGNNSAELANIWNSTKRFGSMSYEADKTLRVTYDISTVGGINEANFKDMVDWWASILGELNLFFKEHPKA